MPILRLKDGERAPQRTIDGGIAKNTHAKPITSIALAGSQQRAGDCPPYLSDFQHHAAMRDVKNWVRFFPWAEGKSA